LQVFQKVSEAQKEALEHHYQNSEEENALGQRDFPFFVADEVLLSHEGGVVDRRVVDPFVAVGQLLGVEVIF